MNPQTDPITIREAVLPLEIGVFFQQLRAYHARDIFPDPLDEDRAYFLSDAYRAQIEALHARAENRCRYLFFTQNGIDVGFALPVIYETEDAKCFLLEFCVYPEYRGRGLGHRCAQTLVNWTKQLGVCYWELGCGADVRRLRFWTRVGFVPNGADEWGEPLLLLPPKDAVPFHVEMLSDPTDWQLLKLENGFLREVGEAPVSDEAKGRLQKAVADGNITFFLAKRGCRAIGMCSVVRCFSTFCCEDTGVFDDFFVEPAFRKQGAARLLAKAAQSWSREQGLSSLTVCCAPCDEAMYQHLGFSLRLGSTFACPI